MTEYRREGKHTVRVGDTVTVAAAECSATGYTFKDRGWSQARVLRLLAERDTVLAEVTVPGRAGTRTVAADRLTRARGH